MKVVAILALAAFTVASAEVGSDTISTLRIVGKLCLCPSNRVETVAQEFFACYDTITPEEKAKFSACQVSTFGGELKTKQYVDYSCTHPWKLPAYVDCLKASFSGAEAELQAAVLKVNQCQAKVVGVN